MIQGRGVRLRRVEREDLPRFVDWMNDAEVREHLSLIFPQGLAQEERWFAGMLDAEPALQPFAIDAALAEGGDRPWTHIGIVGFQALDWRNRSGEVGIFIGRKDLWGRSYGTEALRALLDWGFGELNLHRIHLKVFEDNVRGRRSYEKLGFVEEGRLRQDRFHAGRYRDTLVLGLLREEWPGPP